MLDISNNNEYVWTNSFDPSMPDTSTSKSSKTPIIVGVVLGSLFGILLLLLGGFFLYRRNRKKQDQKDIMQIPGSNNNYPTVPIHNHGQETVPDPAPDKNYNPGQEAITYNHGQEAIPIPTSNNERISVIDINNLKNELRQEIIQILRQEMLQNNGTTSKK
jgi:hypothetical protein